jgi:hypothetical protein
VLGALYLRGTRWFITDQAWQTLSTGLGVLLVLLILPAGLGGLWVKLRDVGVRLLTGQRVDAPPPVQAVDEAAAPPATEGDAAGPLAEGPLADAPLAADVVHAEALHDEALDEAAADVLAAMLDEQGASPTNGHADPTSAEETV